LIGWSRLCVEGLKRRRKKKKLQKASEDLGHYTYKLLLKNLMKPPPDASACL